MSTTPSLHSATARDSDNFNYDLSNAIYGAFPSCATDTLPRRSRAAPPASISNSSRKRKPTPTPTPPTTKPALCHRAITLNRLNSPPTWLPAPKPSTTSSPLATRRRRSQQSTTIHTTTCHALNSASTDDDQETDLCMLPELDDWEEEDADTETETPILTPSSSAELDVVRPFARTGPVSENKWAGVLRRAANSNLERLTSRLEGDGWDFVKQDARDEEDLDEEFDVVVLGRV